MPYVFVLLRRKVCYVNRDIKNSVSASDMEAQYDERAKRLLSHKEILSHILVKTVKEFKGMHPKDVIPYIEGDPEIGSVPAEPGMTNAEATEQSASEERIIGLNTENSEINEGLVRFDIVFYVRMKDGISQIIVNIESQKSEPTEYGLLNRAIFYASRLISSQKGRDFNKSNYDDIKSVVSIWVCMNMAENSMTNINLSESKIIGNYSPKGNIDLLNLVFIGLGREIPEYNEENDLHRMLGVLFSNKLTVNEKLGIMETEYDIPAEEYRYIGEEVNEMCNLGEGIREEALEEGIAKGMAEVVINMYRNGFEIKDIMKAVGKTEKEIQDIIANEIHATV